MSDQVTGDLVAGNAPEVFHGTGWVPDPRAVADVLDDWRQMGLPTSFAQAAPKLMRAGAADDAPLFFWQGEEKVLGRRLPTWNQGQVGSCVGHGSGRAAQDLMLWEIACGDAEEYPGADVAPEVIYGGSRVEIGGGGISGDGSVGAWAADWLMKFGVVVRGRYAGLDLTRYDETTCRTLGRNGIPTELEGVAKVHPVKAAAMVTTKEEGWAAVGAGKPVFPCSDVGFQMQRDARGYCSPSGTWNHCMGTRGRFVHPDNGRSVVIGNSWGAYLSDSHDTITYLDADGKTATVQLPVGCFAITWDVWGRMLGQSDSFALAGFSGWKKTVMDWTP